MGELPFVRLGNGPRTLVIFPALSDAVQDVTELSRRLAWFYRGFADDNTVYLISRKRRLPFGYTTRQMAADYAEVFERSIGGPSDILGLSMGGLVAQHFAADFPQYVRRLVIGVAAHRLSVDGERMVRHWISLAQEERWRELYSENVVLIYTGLRRRVYRFLVRLTSERLLPKPAYPSDCVVSWEACISHEAADRLGAIQPPTLIVGGARDELFPEPLLRQTAQLVPKATLQLIEGTGHGAFAERKRVFDKTVKEFLT
ncbi:MAG: alpha/beta hydrolase [Thermoproteota archaeon]|nr:alpha/beta hydrolase [Thermoproteota archaeon]